MSAGTPLMYQRVRQLACFHLSRGMTQYPHVGDVITRMWDGATFEIRSAENERDALTFGVVEIDTRRH